MFILNNVIVPWNKGTTSKFDIDTLFVSSQSLNQFLVKSTNFLSSGTNRIQWLTPYWMSRRILNALVLHEPHFPPLFTQSTFSGSSTRIRNDSNGSGINNTNIFRPDCSLIWFELHYSSFFRSDKFMFCDRYKGVGIILLYATIASSVGLSKVPLKCGNAFC